VTTWSCFAIKAAYVAVMRALDQPVAPVIERKIG
jgi:hypothetical protein